MIYYIGDNNHLTARLSLNLKVQKQTPIDAAYSEETTVLRIGF